MAWTEAESSCPNGPHQGRRTDQGSTRCPLMPWFHANPLEKEL